MLIEDIDEEDEDKSNMYKYEGTDYSLQPSAADKKAIDELIQSKFSRLTCHLNTNPLVTVH